MTRKNDIYNDFFFFKGKRKAKFKILVVELQERRKERIGKFHA